MKDQETILIVDDDSTNLDVLFTVLDGSGYRVLVAQSGESALEQISLEAPDLVLLDIMMPGMNGFETCRKLKENPETAEIPVIFLTALSDIQNKLKGFESGGVDYITKPIQHEEVTARVRTHLTILNQKRQLERLNQDKNRFFSILAHDLKNPMVTFLSGTEMLLDTHGKNPVKEFEIMQLLNSTANNLYDLLENLLEWARIQTEGKDFNPERCELKTNIAAAMSTLSGSIAAKEILFTDNTPPDLRVFADKNMLQTILRNLLSNAQKFTPRKGRISIDAEASGSTVSVIVRDNGKGMPQRKIPELFRIDVKTKTAGTEGETGTGLGLILSSELLERQGGAISVQSEEGKGTEVTVSLPAG